MKPLSILDRGTLVNEIKLSFYDNPRDRELLEALTAANVRAAHGSAYNLDSHIKHFLETLLGLSISSELGSLGLTQWPPSLVKTYRQPHTPTPEMEKKKVPVHVFSEERGRILPFTPRVVQ